MSQAQQPSTPWYIAPTEQPDWTPVVPPWAWEPPVGRFPWSVNIGDGPPAWNPGQPPSIPEPSDYALIAGLFLLAVVILRKARK